MKKQFGALLVSTFFFTNTSHAETPCDFKGISVGDKTTSAEIMAALGVTKYKMNPKFPSWEESQPVIEKYGLAGSSELAEWDIGPYCDDASCRIPYGVNVGNNNTPVNVFVSLSQSQITEIDVSFNAIYWDEILPILDKKYGHYWKVEHDPNVVITDIETKKSTMLERITLTHKRGGKNPKTHDTRQI